MRHKPTQWVKPLFSDEREKLEKLESMLLMYVSKSIELRQQSNKALQGSEEQEKKKALTASFSNPYEHCDK